MSDVPHIPVLLDEVLAALAPKNNEMYVDGTLGAGGYTRGILDAADCKVIGIDQDPHAHEMAAKWSAPYGERLHLVVGNFGDMVALAKNFPHPARGGGKGGAVAATEDPKTPPLPNAAHSPSPPQAGWIDAIVLDIGVSSMQFDNAERGFSFSKDAPLDMRMSQSGVSAADFLNQADESDIADVIYLYGEEHASRRIAKAIVEARAETPITRTVQLAQIIHQAIGNKGKTDSATKSFQALRIYINGELDALKAGLEAAEQLLKPSGRLIVVSFHSLEDRIVKQFISKRATAPAQQRYMPDVANDNFLPSFTYGKPKKVKASAEEISRNPRARSAVMRVAIRTEHPAMEVAS